MISPSREEVNEDPASLIVFGDLALSFEEDLRSLLHAREDEALQSFLDRVANALRHDLSYQPSAVQNLFPRFVSIIDILSKLGETEGTPVLRFFLLTVCQVSQFIHFFRSRPFPTAKNAYSLGICTGSFAAAAVSISHSMADVIIAGVEAARASFRTTLVSFLTKVEITRTLSRPWSAIVGRKHPVEDLLNAFNKAEATNALSRLYVSAISPSAVTISGPPEMLSDFIAARKLDCHWLPIESPFHAPHVFAEDAISEVTLRLDEAVLSKRPRIPLLSGSDGSLIQAESFAELLRAVSTQVLRDLVNWECTLNTLSSLLAEKGYNRCEVFPFYCTAASMLTSFLTKHTKIEPLIQNTRLVPEDDSQRPTGRFDHSKIAIIGYSGRFPEATNDAEFWDLLRAGKDVHRTIPEDRFDWEAHYDPTGKRKNTSRVKYGCFINDPGLFDARFFNMSPREADNTDPAQRLAITATYEAIERAGLVPNRTPSTQQDRIGVFFGVTSDDWREVNSGQNVDTYFIPGGNRAFVPGRISYYFRFSGPSLSIDTACSSSFAAIQTACGFLWRGECDTAVAGGTNVLTNPDNFAGLDRGHFLSTTGNCNAFDDEASGYCRADAVGAVILKRLEDAIADDDPIFAVIAGTNTNHCGQTDSITRPHEGDQASVFNRVLRYHNVDSHDISYIEMHGTGTQAGDATEMRSVLSVFLPEQKRKPDQPLYLGSAKANIGHSESASGVSSLIKVMLMMQNNEIPPHCGIKNRINRNYPTDLPARNVHIAREPTPWRREGSTNRTRRVFLNNFSAAGGNTAILLEDAPERPRTVTARGGRVFPVTVTARSAESLKGNMEALASFLDENPSMSMSDLSYTTTARRLQHPYRIACSGDSVSSVAEDLRRQLSSLDAKPVPTTAKLPRLAFMFTGQGTLYLSLGMELYAESSEFRNSITRFNSIAQRQGYPSFLPIIDGSAKTLHEFDVCVTHLALVCLQMGLVQLWASWGISPSLVVGHSLGEYAALYAAEVLSASEAIHLVGARATLLQRKCTPYTHAMVAIKGRVDSIQPFLPGSGCEIACRNQPTGTVVAGNKNDVDKLVARLRAENYECILLEIPFAFHSAQVDPILEEFALATAGVRYRSPKVHVLSPLLAQIMAPGEDGFDANYLVQACREPVNFQGALEAARTAGIVDDATVWVEIGAHPTCSGMVKGVFGAHSNTYASLRKATDPWKSITSALTSVYLAGFNVDWNNYHRDVPGAKNVLSLPRYKWILKNHWIMYRNNFCLTKGEGSAVASTPSSAPEVAPKYTYISPSVQRVLEESYDPLASHVLVESDIFHRDLFGVLRGHVVNGAYLCPSSLYGDIALTLARHLVAKTPSVNFDGFDVCDVKVNNPLVALPSETSHFFRVSARANWSSSIIALSIYSVDNQGKSKASHATLNVRLSAKASDWLDEWKTMAYLINGRIRTLQQGVTSGNTHRLKRGMVYKLFESIVKYNPDYQGMAEVMLDTDELEASASVVFQADEDGFGLNPRWIDSLGQIAGFIMNGNENLQSDKQVFINHGWGRMRFAGPLSRDKVYTTYNKMQLVSGTTYAGDTFILDGDCIVAIYEKVTFQGVPRKLLNNLLPSATDNAKPCAPSPAPRKSRPTATPMPSLGNKIKATAIGSNAGFDQVLKILSDEAGVPLGELQPDSQFASYGIDSLLSLTITSRINEEVGLDLPSTLFAEYPTVKDLEKVIASRASTSSPTPQSTPDLTSESEGEEDGHQQTNVDPNALDLGVLLTQVVSQETGVPSSGLQASTSLAELGVDSLLSLTIADALTEALGTEVDNNILVENETLANIEKALNTILGLGSKATTTTVRSPPTDKVITDAPHATSVLLQKPKQQPRKGCLWLFPDGSGSASSYATLDKLDPALAVYGLNCPWRTTPDQMAQSNVQMSQLVAKYLIEVRKHQPHGPYHLGGWSAGGICAFEAARHLSQAGDLVESLILIDSPNPIGLQNPPARMYDFFQSLGIFGGDSKTIPAWLRKHFDAFIRLLDDYEPSPLASAPSTVIVYARDGICKDDSMPRPEIRPDDPREMIWLINNRTDFSADGWASLVGRDRLSVRVIDGVNHFTMMDRGPGMAELSEYIRQSIIKR